MSRVGKLPIKLPAGVTVTFTNQQVEVKGKLGTLKASVHPNVSIKIEADKVSVVRKDEESLSKAVHGLTRTNVNNMVQGVATGFTKELHIVGVGYKAIPKGTKAVELNLGFSHPVLYPLPEGIKIQMLDDKNTQFKLTGPDKKVLGQVAADIRALKPPEPYKGKGIKYADEVIRRKLGKAAAGAGSGGK